ncbi:hypothetical protein [Sphingomonas faeni]|uniref:hypothetical protein n=1 Tax=Sphingomonas faeni TaxID=185950 RepID=UPI00278B0CEF|nr:hypothetical protein [Sphingomonas faeni]MDQ0840221.1 hypothetical protein [Sphingomonas faeni]
MSRIIQFPAPARLYTGTVCVMGDQAAGFEVAHESSTGNSWGEFTSYPSAQEAIAAAYAMNRDRYAGQCDVWVCPAASNDREGM